MANEDEQQQQPPPNQIRTSHSFEMSEDPQSVPTLPSEIIVDILSRLSVESLLRCKSVCKLWSSMISNPHFVKSHLNLSTSNNRYAHHRLIFCDAPRISLKGCFLNDVLNDGSVNDLELHYPYDRSDRVSGSCNGLLLLIAKDDGTLITWNPSIRRSNRLPHCSFRSDLDPMYGLGYDESADDYKVVGIPRVFRDDGLYDAVVKMYSLKTGNWKEIGGCPHGIPASLSCTFLNGALHWLAILGSGSSLLWKIVFLDLAKETFGEILQPVYDDEGDKNLRLGALKEGLCLLCDYSGNHADIWLMKVYGVKDSWTKLASIPYPNDPVQCLFSLPLWISHDGKVLLQLHSKLVVYDPKNCSSSKIRNFDVYLETYTFVESLLSPSRP